MSQENAPSNTDCCAGGNCGCRIDVFPTVRPCPACGGRLRMIGRAVSLELRLNCPSCGFSGPLLSREEIGELL